MKLATARKILEHYLGKENAQIVDNKLVANARGKVFSSYINGTEIGSLHVRREDDHSDSNSDYFAGHFYDSMSQVVNAFLSRDCLLAFETPGEHGTDYFRLRFNVRMEGAGLKMKPVVYIDADLRFAKQDLPRRDVRVEGKKYNVFWPQAGSFRGSIEDDILTNLIDCYLADGDTRGIIMDRVSEVFPDAYALFLQFEQGSKVTA